MRSQATRQRGIALVMVLWLLVLLTVVASSHGRNTRIETRMTFNQAELIKARARAEAGVNRAIMELLRRDRDNLWAVDGRISRFNFEGDTVLIASRHVSGLVDLNRASADTLEKLLAAAGVEQPRRQQLVDATLDWRDRDDLRHLHGAEDKDYRDAGLAWSSRDAAFVSVDEWRYVLGMTGSLFNRLAPYLTVHSGRASVDLELAPPWLVRALTGDEATAQPSTNRAANRNATTYRSGTYHITAQASGNAAAVASLEAVVRISAASDPPFRILSWREPARQIVKQRVN